MSMVLPKSMLRGCFSGRAQRVEDFPQRVVADRVPVVIRSLRFLLQRCTNANTSGSDNGRRAKDERPFIDNREHCLLRGQPLEQGVNDRPEAFTEAPQAGAHATEALTVFVCHRKGSVE